ncbi:hypothetical protein KJ885_02210 [Patescibacteria group bacterium]|nr:hypothetical protein [Patescibacteria group bacterium]
MNTNKTIKSRLQKECACCGKGIKIILYADRSYRGGHFFGKNEIHRKNAKRKVIGKFPGTDYDIIDYLEKPIRHEEYWECPKCYWQY